MKVSVKDRQLASCAGLALRRESESEMEMEIGVSQKRDLRLGVDGGVLNLRNRY